MLPAEPLHQLHQTVRAASEERVAFFLGDQSFEDRFDIFDRARAVGVEHFDHGAHTFKKIGSHRELFAARAQNGGYAHAAFPRELGYRRHGGEPDATTKYHDVLPVGLEFEADAQRPDHIESIPWLEIGQASGAAADDFIKELQASARARDAINALGPAEPDLALVGRRTQQMEKLTGLGGERFGRGLDDEMFVFVVDPFMSDDRTQGFLGWALGRRMAGVWFADHESG